MKYEASTMSTTPDREGWWWGRDPEIMQEEWEPYEVVSAKGILVVEGEGSAGHWVEPLDRFEWGARIPGPDEFPVERAPEQWVALEHLREGAVFETRDGIRAVKSEYRCSNDNPQPLCVLLASGEYAHFTGGAAELVREIDLAEMAGRIKAREQRLADHEAQAIAITTGYIKENETLRADLDAARSRLSEVERERDEMRQALDERYRDPVWQKIEALAHDVVAAAAPVQRDGGKGRDETKPPAGWQWHVFGDGSSNGITVERRRAITTLKEAWDIAKREAAKHGYAPPLPRESAVPSQLAELCAEWEQRAAKHDVEARELSREGCPVWSQDHSSHAKGLRAPSTEGPRERADPLENIVCECHEELRALVGHDHAALFIEGRCRGLAERLEAVSERLHFRAAHRDTREAEGAPDGTAPERARRVTESELLAVNDVLLSATNGARMMQDVDGRKLWAIDAQKIVGAREMLVQLIIATRPPDGTAPDDCDCDGDNHGAFVPKSSRGTAPERAPDEVLVRAILDAIDTLETHALAPESGRLTRLQERLCDALGKPATRPPDGAADPSWLCPCGNRVMGALCTVCKNRRPPDGMPGEPRSPLVHADRDGCEAHEHMQPDCVDCCPQLQSAAPPTVPGEAPGLREAAALVLDGFDNMDDLSGHESMRRIDALRVALASRPPTPPRAPVDADSIPRTSGNGCVCWECGLGVAIDEDGCCVHCGAQAGAITRLHELADEARRFIEGAPVDEAAVRADERERIALRLERDHTPGSYPYQLARRVRANDMPGDDIPRTSTPTPEGADPK